jgi:hypothetical protein
MHTRILVPLDGPALARAIRGAVLAGCFSKPSSASSLVDGLEAKTTPSFLHRNSTAEATLVIAKAKEDDESPCP